MIFSAVTDIVIPEGNVTKIEDANGNILWQKQSSANYTLIDYVYNTSGYPPKITVNQTVDKTTAMQFKYYNIKNNGGNYIGSDGNTDSNYNFRIFGYQSSRIYLDAFGTRNYARTGNTTGSTYEREFGWDVDLNRKYLRNISGEQTELLGSSTYIFTGSSKSSFSESGNLIFFGGGNDLFRLFYYKVYKNKVLVNDFRPAKFNDGTYGIVDTVTGTEYKDTKGYLYGSE